MSDGVHLRNNLGSEESGNGLTQALWADCPLDSIRNGTIQGIICEPPLHSYQETATTVENACGLPTFDNDCTVKGVPAAGGGVALFGTSDTNEGSLQIGGDTAAAFVIPADSASGKKLWFEVEVKKSLITANKAGFFVGLAGEGSGAAGFLAETDFADVDLLGFWNKEGDDTDVDIVCQKTGAAFDTILADAEHLEADTYTRLGFVYDPDGPDKRKIKFYVNGVPLTTYVGEDEGDATVYLGDTTNFPGGEEMSPLIHMEMAANDDVTVTLRRLRCVQLL